MVLFYNNLSYFAKNKYLLFNGKKYPKTNSFYILYI